MENLITNRFHGKLIAMVCWKKRTIWSDDFPWFSHCNAHLVGGFPRISQPCLMTGGGLHHRLRKVHILYTSPTFVDCIPMCPQVALRYPAWHIYIYICYIVLCAYIYMYIYIIHIYIWHSMFINCCIAMQTPTHCWQGFYLGLVGEWV